MTLFDQRGKPFLVHETRVGCVDQGLVYQRHMGYTDRTICRVSQGDEDLVLKVAEKQDWSFYDHLMTERRVLELVGDFEFVPDLVRVYDSDLFFALLRNYVVGGDLHERGGKFPSKEYLDYLCSGVEQVHSRGVANLDLKPVNVVVDENVPLVHLIDFGTAVFACDISADSFEFAFDD